MYVGIIMNHYKNPYQTTRIQWKVGGVIFVAQLDGGVFRIHQWSAKGSPNTRVPHLKKVAKLEGKW